MKPGAGLLLVVVATVVAIAFGREHALEWQSLVRVVVVGWLGWLAWRGRRWAVVALGVVVATAAVGLAVGAVQAGLGTPWGLLFATDALLFAVGYGIFLGARRTGQG